MTYLVLVSILWAFSFGLIKQRLVAADPFVVAFLRLAVSCLVFLPWLRPARLAPALRRRCLAWGAIQFGLMYVLYTAAFRDLTAAAVAVLTVLTPLYVALLDDARARRVHGRRLVAAALAVVGAVVVVWRGGGEAPAWRGALLVQGANLCFAAGQLAYRDLARRGPGAGRTATAGPAEATLIAWMYLGATACTGLLALLLADPARVAPLRAPGAWSALLYLGLLPTALGFHLWNRGAARVTAGAARRGQQPEGAAGGARGVAGVRRDGRPRAHRGRPGPGPDGACAGAGKRGGSRRAPPPGYRRLSATRGAVTRDRAPGPGRPRCRPSPRSASPSACRRRAPPSSRRGSGSGWRSPARPAAGPRT